MLYLASQFAWLLLLAFALGCIMGWLGSPRRMPLASGPFPVLAGCGLILGLLTWLQVVNGSAALWIETALLYLAAYLAGCVVASYIRPPPPVAEAMIGTDGAGLVVSPARAPVESIVPEAAVADATPAEAPASGEAPAGKPKPKRRAGARAKDQAGTGGRKKPVKPPASRPD